MTVPGASLGRDYFSGSVAVAGLRRVMGWLFRAAARSWGEAVGWSGIPESMDRIGAWRSLCIFLAAAILANGWTLWMASKAIPAWGVALRAALFALALLGLRARGAASSILESCILMRLIRR